MRRLRKGLPHRPVIAEYWAAQPKWRRWEYLGRTLRVEEKLSGASTDRSIWLYRQMVDVDLAKKLWPL
jgi:hypothetical protein